MRPTSLATLFFSLSACATALRGSPAAEVQKEYGFGVIFGIKPDDRGILNLLRVASAMDVHLQRVEFTPSDGFVASARRALSQPRWIVERNKDGSIQEVFYYCLYSPAVPDKADCDEKFNRPSR